jgi:hypothetical protein
MNFGGTYAVTFLTDSSLVLTKILTSSRDMKRVIHLTLKPYKFDLSQFKWHHFYDDKPTLSQIDSISRLSSESLFEYNFKFTKDSVFFPTSDSLYRIKRKPRN